MGIRITGTPFLPGLRQLPEMCPGPEIIPLCRLGAHLASQLSSPLLAAQPCHSRALPWPALEAPAGESPFSHKLENRVHSYHFPGAAQLSPWCAARPGGTPVLCPQRRPVRMQRPSSPQAAVPPGQSLLLHLQSTPALSDFPSPHLHFHSLSLGA